eukprot:CAMPEP_0202953390 /NCGR_PEP_ID=MMETSP1395-20130829/45759_1 /ASSEMBLY_ACC=CAM_ASM_000871 /TAXON_ID=5961 /ORGANISM="Blepharisma japonicum, Strain Stock R1072" /LENGTH=64 /DNA_ID=CAMNT_0049666855 /DNA_START=658 /DNA_END=852 /DNA_ORIENTATION=+
MDLGLLNGTMEVPIQAIGLRIKLKEQAFINELMEESTKADGKIMPCMDMEFIREMMEDHMLGII